MVTKVKAILVSPGHIPKGSLTPGINDCKRIEITVQWKLKPLIHDSVHSIVNDMTRENSDCTVKQMSEKGIACADGAVK